MLSVYEDLAPEDAAVILLDQIRSDLDERLDKVARYRKGEFDAPYAPEGLTGEDKDAMRRARQPWCAIPGRAVAQTLSVEGWRSAGGDDGRALTDSPEWQMWQRSKLAAKSNIVHHSGADYGQMFVVSEKRDDGKAYARVLSARYTAMLFEDVVSDANALWALTVLTYPWTAKSGRDMPGRAVLWDRHTRYELELTFTGRTGVQVISQALHGGNGHNPVTRFVGVMDDDGRVTGEIEPLFDWQDAFDQALFNLMTVQKDSAFRTIYGTGIKDEFVVDEMGRTVTDENGNAIPVPVRIAPNTVLRATDPSSRFGAIEGSDQNGYVSALRMLLEQFAGLSQTPPNFLLGTMVNIGAEAMEAAEKSFRRKVSHYQRMFGQAWERVLRIGMILEGREETELMEHGEVIWTDFDNYNFVGTATALGTVARELQVPPRGLWPLVPGISAGMLDEWGKLADEQGDLAVEAEYEPVDWTSETDPADPVGVIT